MATAAASELRPRWADVLAASYIASEVKPRIGTLVGMGDVGSGYSVWNNMRSQSSTT